MKVSWETKKIFDDDSIDISCTCVRIPTLRTHSESIVLETENDVDVEDIKNILKNSP
jgi:aspartate-semialdehyde dehydrogenase